MEAMKKRFAIVAILCCACLFMVACGNEQAVSDSQEDSIEEKASSYYWDSINAGDFQKQCCRISEDGVGVIASSDEEKMVLPENYREVGSAWADPSIRIYEVTESDDNVNYQIYCEQLLYEEDAETSGLSHAVAIRRGFCKVVFIPEEFDTSETLENDYATLAGTEEYSTVVSTTGNGYELHYAMADSFITCPNDEKFMEEQGFTLEELPQ